MSLKVMFDAIRPYLLPIGLLAAGVLLGVFINFDPLGFLRSGPNNASVVSTRSILTGIKPMAQLVSISLQMAKANITVGIEQPGLLNTNLCGFSSSYVAEGTIRAGIDLSQLTEEDLTYDETTDTYTLMLPPAQVTSCSIDYIDQYAGSTTLCPGTDWDEARQLASYMALVGFRDDALENGLQSRAQQQAAMALNTVVKVMTDKDVVIQFRSETVNDDSLDSTCNPQPPTNWAYDTTKQAWIKG